MAGTSSIRKIFDMVWGTPDADDYEEENEYGAEYSDEIDEEGYAEEEETESRGFFNRRSKVVPMAQPQQIRMKIAKPTNFDQAYEIVDQLKGKNAVVINLEYVSKDVARRIVDVLTGAVQALDGNMEKVSNSIFVVAPYNYDIVNDIAKEKIENKLSNSWIK